MIFYRVFEKGLNKKQFLERAIEIPDFYECFGLFKYVTNKIILPMEKKVIIILIFFFKIYTF